MKGLRAYEVLALRQHVGRLVIVECCTGKILRGWLEEPHPKGLWISLVTGFLAPDGGAAVNIHRESVHAVFVCVVAAALTNETGTDVPTDVSTTVSTTVPTDVQEGGAA